MPRGPGLDEKFNFRGSPKPGQDFYMLAVLKKEYITGEQGIIHNNSNNFDFLGTEQDKYFFLCLNHYQDATQDFYDRLYWSADPDDFQYNSLGSYMNEGVARISLTNANRNLVYRSSFDGDFTPAKDSTSYFNAEPDLSKLSRGKKALPVTFIRKELPGDQEYALKETSVFYSIPYKIVNSNTLYSTKSRQSFNNIEWTFRKYEENPTTIGGTSGRSVGILNEGPVNSDKIINFVQLKTLESSKGTSGSFFNYGTAEWRQQSSTTGSSFYMGGASIILKDTSNSDIYINSEKNNIMKINTITGSSNTVINYKSSTVTPSGNTVFFTDNTSRGLTGSDFEIESDTGVCVIFNYRNTENCFTKLTKKSKFDEWFDIYLIPTEENCYLPGGFHTRDNVLFPNSCQNSISLNGITPKKGLDNLKFFSHNSNAPFGTSQIISDPTSLNFNQYFDCTGSTQNGYNHYKDQDYRKIYNLLFFFLIGSLNPVYWNVNNTLPHPTTSGIQAYPNIASEPIFKNGEFSETITFYTWDTYAESSAAYMFNYCRGSDVCGRCSGNNKDAENICFADSLTRRNAVLSNTPNGKALIPLTGKERATGTHSNPGNHLPTFVIVIISVIVVVLCISVIAVLYVKRKKWRESTV